MAAVKTGSATSSACEGRSMIFEWTLSGQSIANNASTISWTLKGAGTSGYVYGGNFNLTINGTKVVDGKYADNRIELHVGTVIASGTTTIAHNADGSKSFSVSFDGAIYSYSTNCSGSGSWTLPTIARASSFGTISGSTIGSAITINITRAASAFTHKVYYSFGSIAKTAINTNAGTSCSWTPSLATLGAQIPNDTSETCTLYLETYNGSTKIGDTVTKKITLNMPSSAVPTISTIAVTEANSLVNSVCPGIYLQSLSKLKITTTAAGIYGSTVSKYTVVFEKITYEGDAVTTGAVKGSGSLAIQVTVIDSRGRSATKTQNVSIKAYTPPKLTTVNIVRNQTTNTTVNCTVSGSAISILSGTTEKNTCDVYIVYATSTNYPAISNNYKVTTSGLTFNNASKSYTGISATSSYYFKVIVKDKFNEVIQEFKISTAAIIMHIVQNGYIGIGKYREKGALDVNGDIYSNGTLVSLNGHTHTWSDVTGKPDIFPVGSVQITVTNTNPGTYLAGTWVAFGQGRTLVGVNTAETEFKTVLKTGGEKTHQLSEVEMPTHRHTVYNVNNSGNVTVPEGSGYGIDFSKNSPFNTYGAKMAMNTTGGNAAHNNLQPYITVYFWRRTA